MNPSPTHPPAPAGTQAGSTPLFNRVFAFMLVAVLPPLLMTAFLAVRSMRGTLADEWNLHQTQLGQSIARLVSARLQTGLAELGALDAALRDGSGRIQPSSLAGDRARKLLEGYLARGGRAVRIELGDTRTLRVRAGAGAGDEALTRRLAETYQSALRTDRAVVSPPVLARSAGTLVFVVARPLIDRGQVAGAIAAVLSLEPVLEALKDAGLPGIRAFIVGESGQLVADLDRNRMISGVDYSGLEVVRLALGELREAGTITREYVDRSSGSAVDMIGTAALVPETGWVVVAEAPRAAAYAGASGATWVIVLLAVAALAAAVGLSLYLSRLIARPLQRLVESAQALAAGRPAPDLPVTDRTEVGALARAFAATTRQVESNLAGMRSVVEDSQQLFLGTVRALANAIDGKDPYTRGHTERVSRFAVEIGRILELPESDVEKIGIGGLLHDVGKIAVDDKILKKPGILTDEEYKIMKTHPARSYEMMKHIPQLADIIPALYAHHEQLDGKGYPRGLRGDEIPMIARIVAVADCFDAMTTKRPYQDPAPIDYVLGLIRSQAGKKYDERVVEALVRGVKTGRIIPHTAT